MATNWDEIHSIKQTSHPLVCQVITISDSCYFIISEDGTTEDGQEHFDTLMEAVNEADLMY